MRSPEDAPTDADQLIRFARVASVDLGAARCTVEFDDGIESGPIRWVEGRQGTTAIWSPPTIGEQVVLLCPAGEIGAGVALRGISCAEFPPAGNAAIDLVRFGDGAVLSYDADANAMVVNLPAGGTVSIDAAGGVAIAGPVTITGNVDITGDVAVSGTLTASTDVVGGGISLKSHRHGGVSTGGGTTGTPQ